MHITNVNIGHNDETGIVVYSDEDDTSPPMLLDAGELYPMPSAATTTGSTALPPSGHEAAQQSKGEAAGTTTDCVMDDATCGVGEQ